MKMAQLSMIKESKSAATIRRKRHMGSLANSGKSKQDEDCDSAEDPDPELEKVQMGPPVVRLLLCSEKTLFLGLLAFRVLNSLMIQTSFVPDEYWQSIEVAHKMTFGYGYLTWEWHHGLRGYSYPAMFAVLYKILAILRLDYRILLIKLPRILQAVFAALGDLYLFKFSNKLSGQKVALWSLLCQLTSWFIFYCSTRTMSNSMETVLTTMALFYFPWPGKLKKASWKYVCLMGLAVVVRPTALIVWAPLCAWHVWTQRHAIWGVVKVFAEIGFLILLLSSLVDLAFYGKWVNVNYNFLEFNVISNLGTFYGSHPWHWYLTQGFATVMGMQLFPFLLAARNGMEKVALGIIAWTVFVYSLLEHKEFRFLLPVLPLAMHVCGRYLSHACEPAPESDATANTMLSRQGLAVILLVVTNLPMALYFSLIHQRGTIDVMNFLHDESYKNDRHLMKVIFLMPCHSTPYYSYLHRNISMRFLTCEPNISKDPDYEDEAEVFYNDPPAWLATNVPRSQSLAPSHLVLFDVLQPQIRRFLEQQGFVECGTFFHTHVPEGRVGGRVVVLCTVEWKISSGITDSMRAWTKARPKDHGLPPPGTKPHKAQRKGRRG